MTFRAKLPWVSLPLIVNAPMGDFAGPELAAAVSRAGGLGMIGGMIDPNVLDKQLTQASELLSDLEADKTSLLPCGIGLLLFALSGKRSQVVEVLARHKPAVVWLFAEHGLNDYTVWTDDLRRALPDAQIWIQTASVSGALEVVRTAKPDVLVMQGTDAGGHGWERGAGIISLVPETKDALVREGLDVAVVASGGIVESRGAAAALMLGAEAVVMGTRFLASKEIMIHSQYQRQILDTRDGGQQTCRAKVFDELRGPNIWPKSYNGRALVSKSYEDYAAGVDIDQLRNRHAEALAKDDKGWGESRRGVVWAGTGVGLVNQVSPAADIVDEVRQGVKSLLSRSSEKWTQ